MRPEEYNLPRLVELLENERIATLDRIAEVLGGPSRITVFRKLAQLGARASYSHRGGYQTLDRIAEYDENGLWTLRGVHFSKQGTLLQTIVYLVEHSKQGYFASELQALLQVRVHNALAQLDAAKLLRREQHVDRYLYVSSRGGTAQPGEPHLLTALILVVADDEDAEGADGDERQDQGEDIDPIPAGSCLHRCCGPPSPAFGPFHSAQMTRLTRLCGNARYAPFNRMAGDARYLRFAVVRSPFRGRVSSPERACP